MTLYSHFYIKYHIDFQHFFCSKIISFIYIIVFLHAKELTK